MTSVVYPEYGYNAGEKRILDLHLSVTGHSLNPGPKPSPSGFYVCSRHSELPPMSLMEFTNHKGIQETADNSKRAYNAQLGLVGLFRNMGIQTCEGISVPEGDPRLKLVSVTSGTAGQLVVKEIEVLVTCRYCGARASQGTPRCPKCGANL